MQPDLLTFNPILTQYACLGPALPLPTSDPALP